MCIKLPIGLYTTYQNLVWVFSGPGPEDQRPGKIVFRGFVEPERVGLLHPVHGLQIGRLPRQILPRRFEFQSQVRRSVRFSLGVSASLIQSLQQRMASQWNSIFLHFH